ncbi:HSP20-like chaperone [Pseudocohnilembus persalinus]|uniref:Calcyclin-binding protein n=1 Tax=Pseudocohnilembus persalinus TaxID=266149 RepID=A0A0V0Q825_PSEPJ|nr:HSP20-like chaperone [Pseudocohnilembus persalinus]|eukprot:KRW98350.1 HSP20-like chaperone [Pseudocohnilembus persalinus]
MQIQELQEDIEELKFLLSQSKRSSNQNCLQNEIQKIQQIIDKQKKIEQQNSEKEVQNQQQDKQNIQTKKQKEIIYQSINDYSFEQEGKKIKVYIFLDNVGNVDKNDIQVDIQQNSLSLLIHNYNNRNLQFKIPKLQDKINPENSKFIQKQNRVTFILEKNSSLTWDQLAYKENKLKDDTKEKIDDKDPQASLMNLMKQMYDSGDDEMKRTINKAWAESQQKKQSGLI